MYFSIGVMSESNRSLEHDKEVGPLHCITDLNQVIGPTGAHRPHDRKGHRGTSRSLLAPLMVYIGGIGYPFEGDWVARKTRAVILGPPMGALWASPVKSSFPQLRSSPPPDYM